MNVVELELSIYRDHTYRHYLQILNKFKMFKTAYMPETTVPSTNCN